MSENAPLQDRFSKRVCSWRTSIPLENTALFGGIQDDDDTDEIFVRREQKLIQRHNTFRTRQERRT